MKPALAPPGRAEQLALVVFFCAAVAAFGSSYQQPAIWIFWLPAAISILWRIPAAPRQLVHALRNFSWTLLGGAVLLGLLLMAYAAIISETTAKFATLLCGYGLASFAAVFLIGTPVWPVAEAALPAATGLLLVAAFNPTAKITPLLIGPGVAGLVYLLLTRRDGRPVWSLLSFRLLMTVAASSAVAWSFFTFLPPLQGQVETTALRWMMSESGAATPAAMQSRLGDIEELKLSKRIVMRVWTTQPQKLRGRVFGRFDGRMWLAHITRTAPLNTVPTSPWLADVSGNVFALGNSAFDASARDVVSTRIEQVVIPPGVLLSPPNKILARVPVSSLSVDGAENLSLPLTAGVRTYGIVNRPDALGTEASESEFLALPPKLDPRWRPVAEKLAKEGASPGDRIARTVEYVKNAATYSLQVGAFQTADPTAEFFFVKHRGYCQYFATSAVILLRLQGIPARYVTGYVVQEYNTIAGHYVVRDADAHAWIEVFTPQTGWKEADPTPEAEFVARRQNNGAGRIGQAAEYLAALFSEIWIRVHESDWRGLVALFGTAARWIAAALLVVLILALAWLARRFRRRHAPAAKSSPLRVEPARLQQYPELLKRCWDTAGYPRPGSRGLREHAELIPLPELRHLSTRVVDAYYQGSYGTGELSPEQLRELDELASQLKRGGPASAPATR